MTRITFIADTHNKHKQVLKDLPGGDIIIHAGDATSMGYRHEIKEYFEWYNKLFKYKNNIMIAGNHDFGFQKNPEDIRLLLEEYPYVHYLEDNQIDIDDIKIWGTPWQPWFYNWAFNLPRNGDELKAKWDMIPEDIDILITHGPPFGYLDVVAGRTDHLGCELLTERLKIVKPKIHVFGHIHTGYAIKEVDGVLFVNAAVLNEQYYYVNKPITIDYDFTTKIWNIVDN